MSKTIEYKIKVDAGSSVKTLGQLEDELQQINEELKTVDKGSKRFKELAKSAQTATREIEEINREVEGLTIDKKFEAADGAVKVAAGSLATFVGTLGLLGVESEALEEFEKKAASAIAVGLGLKDISEGFNQLRKSTVLATLASETFGKVTKRALISTGIGALVVALGTIVAYWDDINKFVKSIGEESLEDLNEKLNTSLETSEGIVSVIESQIGLEEAKGLSTLESNKKLLDQLKLQIDITNELIAQKQIELQDEEDQNAQLTFWEKLKLGIFQATGAYGAFGRTLAESVNPESEKTKELQGEINELTVRSNNLQTKYASVLGTVATQQEMAAGGAQKVEVQSRGLATVTDSLTSQIQANTGVIDANAQALLKKTADERLAEAQKQAQITKEQQYQEGLYSSVDAITNLSAVLGQESTAAKALAISTALINTYLGVTEALKQKSTLPSPFDVITKVANVATILATGLKAVQSIKSTPARGTGGGGGGFGVPSVRSASAQAPATPTVSTPSLQDLANVETATQSERQQPIEAYVLEGNVTSAQEASRKIRQRRTIGR